MSKIDPTARIEDGAVIGDDVVIGPYCIIGAHVNIGNRCKLLSHVNIAGETTIGANSTMYPFVSLGTPPQSLGHRGELTRLETGESCTFREMVSINAGTVGGGGITRVGARGYFMAYSHVAHDCQVGNDVVMANGAQMGGHCDVGDYVFFGGLSAMHQFVRIGSQSMIAGVSGLRHDVIPYGMVTGQFAHLEGLNVVGMRRRGFTHSRLKLVREFYQRLFHGAGIFSDRLESVRAMKDADPAIAEILKFIDDSGKRPLCMAHNNPAKSTERSHLES